MSDQTTIETLMSLSREELSSEQCLELIRAINVEALTLDERIRLVKHTHKLTGSFGHIEEFTYEIESLLEDHEEEMELDDYVMMIWCLCNQKQAISLFSQTIKDVDRACERVRLAGPGHDEKLLKLLLIRFEASYNQTRYDQMQETIDTIGELTLGAKVSPEPRAKLQWAKGMLAMEVHLDADQAYEEFAKGVHLSKLCGDGNYNYYSITNAQSWLMLCDGDFEKARLFAGSIDIKNPYYAMYKKPQEMISLIAQGRYDEGNVILESIIQEADKYSAPALKIVCHLWGVWAAFIHRRMDEVQERMSEIAKLSVLCKGTFDEHWNLMTQFLAMQQGQAFALETLTLGPMLEPARQAILAWIRGKTYEFPRLADPLARVIHQQIHQLPAPICMLGEEKLFLRSPNGEVHDLTRRGPLARLMDAFMQVQLLPDNTLSTMDLFEAGWPDVEHVSRNGFRRVYTEIHRLREWEIPLLSVKEGYQMASPILWIRDENAEF